MHALQVALREQTEPVLFATGTNTYEQRSSSQNTGAPKAISMYVKDLIVASIRTEEQQGSHVSRRHYSYPSCWTIQTLPVNESSDPLQSKQLLQQQIRTSQCVSRTVWPPCLGLVAVGHRQKHSNTGLYSSGLYACHIPLYDEGNMQKQLRYSRTETSGPSCDALMIPFVVSLCCSAVHVAWSRSEF